MLRATSLSWPRGLSAALACSLAVGMATDLVSCASPAPPPQESPRVAAVVPVASAPAQPPLAPSATAASKPEGEPSEDCLITPESSRVDFTGAKLTGTHQGSFGAFRGTIRLNRWRMVASRIEVVIDTNSLSTDQDKLTAHLKSADFFDVARFPTATFASTTIRAGGARDATYTVVGDLTLHGLRKEISFPVTLTPGEGAVKAQAEAEIKRKDFGLEYPGKIDDLIRNEVSIRLTIDAPCRKR